MELLKRYFVIVFVLGLSLGLVTAALAAADSKQPLTIQESDRTGAELSLPVFEDRSIPVARVAQSIDPPGTLPNGEKPSPDKERFSSLPNLSRSSTGSAFLANPAAQLPLAPPLPAGSEDFAICLESKRVWGTVGAGETVTVTVNGVQMGASLADDLGFFWTTLYDDTGNRPGLSAGDVVIIYSAGVQQASVTLRDIAGDLDVVNDTVSGVIGGSGFPLDVTVYAREEEPSMTAYTQSATTDGSGNFSVDFTGTWDFFGDDRALVAYNENGVEVHRHIYAQRLVVLPYPLLNIVGWTTPGVDVTATVYLPDGITIREQMVGSSNENTGRYEFPPSELQVDDIVVVEIAGGTVLSRTVDTLTINVDPANDRVTGEADSGAVVRGIARNLTVLGGQEVQASATASGGAYTLDYGMLADLMPGDWAGVYISDAEGDELVLWAPSPSVYVNQTWNDVYGNGPAGVGPDSDGLPITLTLSSTGAEYYTTSDYWSWYQFTLDEQVLPDIGPGDVITVEAQGYAWQGVVEVQAMTAQADPVANEFSGEVETPPTRVELSGNYYQGQLYPLAGQFETLVTASSPFTAAVAGFDINGDLRYDVLHRTTDEYAELISRQTDGVGAVLSYNGLGGTLNPPGVAYTLTLYDSSDNLKAEITGNSNEPDGNTGWTNLWDYGVQVEPGDKLQAQSADGFAHTVVIPDIFAVYDPDTDVITGQGPVNDLVLVRVGEGEQYQGYVPTDASGNFQVAVNQLQLADGDGDLPWGQDISVTYYDEKNTWLVNSVFWPQVRMDVNYAHEWVEVQTLPNEAVTVTLASGYQVAGTSGTDGWFRTYDWPWDPEDPNIQVGDVITAEAIGMQSTVDPVGQINIEPDFDTDIVAGTIGAPWFDPLTLTVSCEIWEENGASVQVEGVDPNGGSYACDFSSEGWDLQPGQSIAVRYHEPDGDSVINVFQSPWMRVNYAHDWVGGDYEAGHTIWVTLTESDGVTVKATAELETRPGGGWSGDGFETRDEDWTPQRPDIEVGDWVFIQADDDYSNEIKVGEIGGSLDVDTDSVSGPIYADWFTETLYVECHPWGAPGPAPTKDSSAEPDGSSPYLCQWNPGSEWDILPGQDVAVMYQEPDRDRVINVFREPSPDLRVEKWAEGSGQVMPGGPAVYTIRYINDGDADAATFTITDTLPLNTSYASDTSGVSPTSGTGWVSWELGPLAPGEEGQFQLYLNHTANLGDMLHNVVDVYVEYDSNPDNNHAEADAEVIDEVPDLYVNKNPSPGDPTPGQTMLWEINYGNNRPVASGFVVLTDTLPANTSIVSWYSENGYDAWDDSSSTADELVLTAPGIPGNWGDRILLRLLIDAGVQYDTQLTNTVAITTAAEPPDLTGDNRQVRDDVWVSNPRWDGSLWKSFNWGRLVPGGQVEFSLSFRNNGNMTTHFILTDTLPAGTTFETAMLYTGRTSIPFPPDEIVDGVISWDIGSLEPGEWHDIGVRLNIDTDVSPGTELNNCAEIAIDGPDSWPLDNQDCLSETVNNFGPNLRVVKEYQWNWYGQLNYQIRIENIGTEYLDNLWITDTYPVSTNFSGDWWVNYGPWITMTQDVPNRQLIFWVDELWPGNTAKVGFNANLDGGIIGEQGLAFTNVVEAPVPDDVNPADNYDEITAYTGPDVYIEKWLSEGEVLPGEIVTFTVEFGNQNFWPWNGDDQYGSHITETLPAGMSFITATAPWDSNEVWVPEIIDGNTIVWGWGTMWSNSTWWFDLVVQIADTVEGGDVLVNQIEAYGDSPDDVEYNWDNNVYELPLTILGPNLEVAKVYDTNMVAGTEVVYTLTVTNVGNEAATTVVLSDTLPANLTYADSDGSLTSGDVLWTFTSVAPNGGIASGWFSGELACTAGLTVDNEHYGVVSSDQGVVSDEGDLVSFVIISPTITVDFDQSADTISEGEQVDFTADTTTDGTALSYAWDFGDGGSGTGVTPSHTYTTAGVYDVSLTVTDGCGYSETITVEDAVTVERVNFLIYLPLVVR